MPPVAGWSRWPGGSTADRPHSCRNLINKDGRLRWQHVVVSLQAVLGQQLAVGGGTALELQGFTHYLGAGEMRKSTFMVRNDRRHGSAS